LRTYTERREVFDGWVVGWLGGFLLPFLKAEGEIMQRREDVEFDDRNEV
jgi:hypothetical protein